MRSLRRRVQKEKNVQNCLGRQHPWLENGTQMVNKQISIQTGRKKTKRECRGQGRKGWSAMVKVAERLNKMMEKRPLDVK